MLELLLLNDYLSSTGRGFLVVSSFESRLKGREIFLLKNLNIQNFSCFFPCLNIFSNTYVIKNVLLCTKEGKGVSMTNNRVLHLNRRCPTSVRLNVLNTSPEEEGFIRVTKKHLKFF